MPNEQTSLKGNLKEKKTTTISELAQYHLKNRSHTTTDEELRNATVEISGITPNIEENLFELDNTTVTTPLPGETEGKTGDCSKSL